MWYREEDSVYFRSIKNEHDQKVAGVMLTADSGKLRYEAHYIYPDEAISIIGSYDSLEEAQNEALSFLNKNNLI